MGAGRQFDHTNVVGWYGPGQSSEPGSEPSVPGSEGGEWAVGEGFWEAKNE